jgi:hypothetical protein
MAYKKCKHTQSRSLSVGWSISGHHRTR